MMATRADDGESVALKVVPGSQDLEIAKRLGNHPGFCPIFGSFSVDESVVIEMPFRESGDLLNYFSRVGNLSVAKRVDFIGQIAAALAHAHSCGVALMDISIENILMASETKVEICDFGQAVIFTDPVMEISTLKGKKTRPFEFYTREKVNVTKIDIFGFGVISALLFTDPQNHANLIEEISMFDRFSASINHVLTAPRKVKKLILAMLEFCPENRPAAAEVVEALLHVHADRNVHAELSHAIEKIAEEALSRIGVDSPRTIFRNFTETVKKLGI